MAATTSESDVPETPAVFWACKSITVSSVNAKFTEKEQFWTKLFFCRQDPDPVTFHFQCKFGSENDGWLSLYVGPSNREVKFTSLRFFVHDDQGKLLQDRTCVPSQRLKKGKSHGWAKFFAHVDAANGPWRVSCEVKYEVSPPDYVQTSTHKSNHRSDLLKLFESAKYSDVTFLVGEERILAHKAIVTTRSSYFDSMFDANMKESASNEVRVTDADPKVFAALIRFLYSGLPPKKLSEYPMELLVLADKYGLTDLKNVCEGWLCTNICLNNAVESLLLAEKHHCLQLQCRARVFLQTHMVTLKRDKEKWSLLQTEPELVVRLMEEFSDE